MYERYQPPRGRDIDMRELILVRGLPGSGKTYTAKRLMSKMPKSQPVEHYEADMFFEQSGTYEFDEDILVEAQDWCLNQTLVALTEGKTAIVSNTFTQMWEMQPYFDLATTLHPYGGPLDNRVKVWVYTVLGNHGNVHSVPAATIERMKSRWEQYKGEIIIDNPLSLNYGE
jgi:hypothetical protein